MRGKPTHVVRPHIHFRCRKCKWPAVQGADDPVPVAAKGWFDNDCEHDWKQSNNKVQLIDGVPHRKRRGQWVPIPEEWFGHKPDEQTKRKRQANETVSKRSRKHS